MHFCGHLLRGGVDWNWFEFRRLYWQGVTSYAEVWIEMEKKGERSKRKRVTSYAEVWIEILNSLIKSTSEKSHLLRGGVDWNLGFRRCPQSYHVTSYAEVWIEIIKVSPMEISYKVTSYAEVWIEISVMAGTWSDRVRSPPTRRCGLK